MTAMQLVQSRASGGVVVRAAWIASQVFARGKVWAYLAFPAHIVSLLTVGKRHIHFSADRSGVVVLAPYRPAQSVARLAAMLALTFVPIVAATVWLDTSRTLASAFAALLIAILTMLAYGVLFVSSLSVLFDGGVPRTSAGSETPNGNRQLLSTLAQLPGSTGSIVYGLRSLIHQLPSGTVVVGTARTEELANRYSQLGFVRGRFTRIFYVVP